MTELPFITCGKTRLLNLPHASAVIREIWDDDCYRLNEIPDGSIVLDVGAFYGEFGLICCINKNCAVMAYEPSRMNYLVASLNKQLNVPPRGQYMLRNCGISGRESKSTFYYRPDHPAGSLFSPSIGGVEETVISHPLSSEIHHIRSRYGCDSPLVVKLDCEGSEDSIFVEDQTWMQYAHVVTMEWHNHDGDLYADILKRNGFHVELEGGGPKPRPKWDKSIGGGLLFAKRKTDK